MLDKKNHFFCQSCSKKTEISMLLVCCMRVLCPACQKIKHDCFQPKLLPITPVKHKFCQRCTNKIAKIQCSNCLYKQFCVQCSNVLHKPGKFNYHIKYEIQDKKGEKCSNHHIPKQLQTKGRHHECLNCFYDKQMIPFVSKNKLQLSCQQIKTKLSIERNLIKNTQIIGQQSWMQIEIQAKKKFQKIHEQLVNIQNQFEQTIQKKKSAMLELIKEKQQNIQILQNQHKNVVALLQQQAQQSIRGLISTKIKHILSNISHIQRLTFSQHIFIPTSLHNILSQLKQITVNKLISKNRQSFDANDKKSMSGSILKNSKSQNNLHIKFRPSIAFQAFANSKNLNLSVNNDQDLHNSTKIHTQGNEPKKLKNCSSQLLLKHQKGNLSTIYKSHKYLLNKDKLIDPIKQVIKQRKKSYI